MKDPALVGVLSRLKVGREIPPSQYRAVAAILALIHRINRPAV